MPNASGSLERGWSGRGLHREWGKGENAGGGEAAGQQMTLAYCLGGGYSRESGPQRGQMKEEETRCVKNLMENGTRRGWENSKAFGVNN